MSENKEVIAISTPTPPTSPTPASVAPTANPIVKVENTTPIWLVVAIAVLVSATSSYATWYAMRTQNVQQPTKVVIVDMARIAVAKGFSTTNTGESPEVAAKKFLTDMETLNQAFSKDGVLVINSQAAFNRPVGMDVTVQYAKALGVVLTNGEK